MISIESLTAAQQQFASRFSLEDWTVLCRNQKFLDAVSALEFDTAEVIAWSELTQRNATEDDIRVQQMINHDRLHAAVCDFVRIWAAKTKRTGGAHKQSRQGHIRKLMKHGLQSDYFRKMAAEAGLV